MPLLPDADPWSADGDHVGILAIHGFTGSPKSMKPLGHALAGEGWTVRVPRLPGHGTTWQEMNLTRWQDWYAEVERNYRELSERSERVFVMGLSMGGTLTLRLAEQHGDAIAGIVLVNASVQTERKDRFLLPVVSKFIGGFPGISNDIAKPGVDEGAYDKTPLKAAQSLSEFWSITKADIAQVTQPVLLFRSKVDHVVEPSNAEFILSHITSSDVEEVVLERSYHVATLDYDAEQIEQGSIAFVRRLIS